MMASSKPERWKEVKVGEGRKVKTPQYMSKILAPSFGGLHKPVNLKLGTILPIIADGETVKIEIQSQPFSNVPFERNADFVGRGPLLDDIDKALQPTVTSRHSRAALVGPPGVGKTQIAVEYATRARADSPQLWVFWVDARTDDSFIDSYRKLARDAKIPGWEEAKTSHLPDLVFEWLRNEQVGPWLLILDSNDDPITLFMVRPTEEGKPGRSLATYIPHTPNGSVLVTTRCAPAPKGLGVSASIAVPPLDLPDARALFRKKVTSETVADADPDSLLEKLEYLPLAITLAAAYMAQSSTAVHDYLALLEKESEVVKVLVEGGRVNQVSRSVIRAWAVSFEFLQAHEPDVVELLQMLCFLNRHSIQKMLLLRDAEEESVSESTVLGPLLDFSFMSRAKSDDDVYEMHSLVHFLTSIWVTEHDAHKYAAMALRAVSDVFPPADDPDESICQQLKPHAKIILNATSANGLYEVRDPDDKRTRATLLHNAACYEMDLGNLKVAEAWADEALQIRKEQLGEDNTLTLESMHNSALAYYEAGKPGEAVRRQEEVVRRVANTQGGASSMALIAKHALVKYYLDVGRWAEAESLATEVVAASEALGPDEQEDTWDRKMTLVDVLRSAGKYSLAQTLVEAILAEKLAQIRADHEEDPPATPKPHPPTDDTLLSTAYDLPTTLLTLSRIHHSLGAYPPALSHLQHALSSLTAHLGPSHPAALRCATDLAALHHSTGDLPAAIALGQTATAQLAATLGPSHPDTLAAWSSLARAYESAGRFADAETDGRIVTRLAAETLGEENRLTLLARGNLASALRGLGRLDEAREVGAEVLKQRVLVLGPQHGDVLAGVVGLAGTYLKMGRAGEVRGLFAWAAGLGSQAGEGVVLGGAGGGGGGGESVAAVGGSLPRRVGRRVLGWFRVLFSVLFAYWRRQGRVMLFFARIWRALVVLKQRVTRGKGG